MAIYKGNRKILRVYLGARKIFDAAPVVSLLTGDGGVGSVYQSNTATQWLADGRPILGEYGLTYTVTDDTAGAVISQRGSVAVASLVISAIQPVSETVQPAGSTVLVPIPVTGGTSPYAYAAAGYTFDGNSLVIPADAPLDTTITVNVTDSGTPPQTASATISAIVAEVVDPDPTDPDPDPTDPEPTDPNDGVYVYGDESYVYGDDSYTYSE